MLTLIILVMTIGLAIDRYRWMAAPVAVYAFWQMGLILWMSVEKTYEAHWFRMVDDLRTEKERWKERADHLEKVISVIGKHEAIKLWEQGKTEKEAVVDGNSKT